MAINNPYVPGDPYSYDLKWMVQEVKAAKAVGEQAAGSAAAAAASAEAASDSAYNAGTYANNAEASAENAADSAADAAGVVAPVTQALNTQGQQINVLEGRMNTFASLTEGSTTGDAELQDIRVAADGTVYPTAGNAVRGQVNELESQFTDLNGYVVKYPLSWIDGGYINNTTGAVVEHNNWHYTDFIPLVEGKKLLVSTNKIGDNVYNAFYDSNQAFIQNIYITGGSNKAVINVPSNAKYARFSVESQYIITAYPTLETISNLSARIEDLENLNNNLPDYYNAYLIEKNDRVNTRMDTISNCASFVFFTDPHISSNEKHSGEMIKNIIKNTGVKDIICGGDIISAYGTENSIISDCEVYKTIWGDLRPYYVRGNHDIYAKATENTNTGIIKSNSMVENRFMRPAHDDIVNPENKTYYYIDRPNNQMRYIFIDTSENINSEIVDNIWNPTYSISQAQVDWFISLLQNTPTNYKIVVFNHIPITNHIAWSSPFTLIFGNIIEAFNNKTIISETDSFGITAYADFSTASGKVILSICGHGHTDDYYTSPSGCVYYEVNCDCTLNNGGSQYPRTVGTTTEQAFDVVIIDATDGAIHTIRYGAGIDKTLIQY